VGTLLKLVAVGGVVVVAAIATVYVALAVMFSGWGDRSPAVVITRNEGVQPIVLFLCDDAYPITDCRGREMPGRSTVVDELQAVGHGGDQFAGEVIVTDESCAVLSRTKQVGRGDMALVISPDKVELRTQISPYSERYAPGFEVLGWSLPHDVVCPLDAG
jgi:hypothetical protein